jgi:hypothetical protein
MKPEYIELAQSEDGEVERLMTLYRQNKHHARVVFFHERMKVEKTRLVAYTRTDSTFELVVYKRVWGISKTNIMYNRQSKVESFVLSKNGFFYVRGKLVRPLTLKAINDSDYTKEIIKFITPYTPFVELLNTHSLLIHKTFNYIIEHKLTSLKKMLSYEYGLPYPVIKTLKAAKVFQNPDNLEQFRIKVFFAKDYITNYSNINMEYFADWKTYELFRDTIDMARTLGYKVNAAWSLKRLKAEHDYFATVLTDITLTATDKLLCIGRKFLDFEEFSGYHMIKSTKELALEGKKQSHCVVSYTDKINRWESAIYHIDGYTLELVPDGKELRINQLRGYKNDSAPEELELSVRNKLAEFNEINRAEPEDVFTDVNVKKESKAGVFDWFE